MIKRTKYEKKAIESPTTFLNPVPAVMVSCRGVSKGFENDNIITIAWAGTINSQPPMLSVSIRKSRHSHRQISESKEFVVNLVSKELMDACDFCGVKSGKDVDKFKACNLTKETASGLENSVAIKESPVSLSCKVKDVIELGSHDMFLAEIIAVTVGEELYNSNGKIDLSKSNLVVYSHGEYYSLKRPEGFFGYSVASKEALNRRLPKSGGQVH